MGASERRRELKRRRHRRKKVAQFKQKVAKASVSEKAMVATKLRNLTPGADVIIDALGLEER